MEITSTRSAPMWGTVLLTVLAIAIAGVLIFVGLRLYTLGAKPLEDFYVKLGELALQLAVVVIVGALVKTVVDWGTSQRARYLEKLEARKEFLRRVRAIHVAIKYSRDLLNAHRSAKTWTEQSRRLMELRPDVEEISEDLKASPKLFAKNIEIINGLEGIITYLEEAAEEYVRSHEAVDSGYNAGKSLAQTIQDRNMTWIRDFIEGGEGYKKKYEANLSRSKSPMRLEVYGA